MRKRSGGAAGIPGKGRGRAATGAASHGEMELSIGKNMGRFPTDGDINGKIIGTFPINGGTNGTFMGTFPIDGGIDGKIVGLTS